MTIRTDFGVASRYASADFMAGIECENVVTKDKWIIDTDGSLRNHGREFISNPFSRQQLLEIFAELHGVIEYITNSKERRFTHRTSIHVHINCLDLEPVQVKQIMLWYALFEPIFFKVAAPHRANNIHCVGLDQTVLSDYYKRDLTYLHSKWSKYTALNLLPLSEYGTIEFRHLEGTDSVEKLNDWLTILENLWVFGKSTPIIKEKLTDTEIQIAFSKIFGATQYRRFAPLLSTLLTNSLFDLKLSLV
jgi:Putative amidoligase enzyme